MGAHTRLIDFCCILPGNLVVFFVAGDWPKTFSELIFLTPAAEVVTHLSHKKQSTAQHSTAQHGRMTTGAQSQSRKLRSICHTTTLTGADISGRSRYRRNIFKRNHKRMNITPAWRTARSLEKEITTMQND